MSVGAIYQAANGGTVLGNGKVTAVEQRPDGSYWVTVEQLNDVDNIGPRRYIVSRNGATDALLPRPVNGAAR